MRIVGAYAHSRRIPVDIYLTLCYNLPMSKVTSNIVQRDENIAYYARSLHLIDERVVEKTAHLWPYGTVIFYAQRQHYIDVIPEFLFSIVSFLALVSLFVVWLQIPSLFDSEALATFIMVVTFAFVSGMYFFLEVLRWSQNSLLLTNRGLYNPHFKLLSLDLKNPRIDWITSAVPKIPLSYKFAKLDVGSMIAKSADGTIYQTPACQFPNELNGYIPVAEEFKPGDIVQGEVLWNE